MSDLPDNLLQVVILAAAIRALRTRAAYRKKAAEERITTSEKGVVIVPSEARADLDFADDLAAVADEIEAEGVR